ncbi:MAG TPA: translocation/assembly module TamB domain-containing protein [Caulobacter sp.]|nr:translocation/assembly module TamB domain-containing protein [Caulobacter sp.]
MSASDDTPPVRAPDHRRRWFPSSAPGWLILISVVAVVFVAAAAVGVRYGLNTVPGLAFIEARANGLKIGRYGKLKIEGVSGDIWRNVSIRRLIIYDEKGIWLEGKNLNMKWRYHELFVRRFHADAIVAEQITLSRRPTLTPKEKSGSLPVTILIDALKARVDSRPAFSQVEGRFDLEGRLALQRRGGGTSGRFVARSLMRQGDFADIGFDLGRSEALLVNAKASEARGGALAGALGLDAAEPFALDAQLRGTVKAGRFNLLVESGDAQPAKAEGSWNAGGGSANGYVRLDASRLTGLYARMFGPQVKFDISGRKASGAYYDIRARLDSEGLSATAAGLADLGKRTAAPSGLAVTGSTGSLGRLTWNSVTGAATFRGLFKGDADSFSLTGDLRGSSVSVAGYTLASAGGRTTLARSKGELTLISALTGQGGRGKGYLPALLGAAPVADVDMIIFKDGRLLMRRIRANGAGLKVDAQGSRGLFGGLSFNGKAELWNFGAAKLGGKGRLAGSWSADQGGAGKPWVFTVDARGSNLALGWSELDRLLGAAPRLRGKASLRGGAVDVADLRLDGDKAAAKGQGRIGGKGELAFNLDWTAEGPFRAGPLEVSGKAKGDGTLGGTLSAPRADLTAQVEAIDLPRLPLRNAALALTFMRRPGGGDGAFSITAESPYGPARLRTDFAFAAGGLDLSGLDADAGGIKAQGAVALRRGRPSSANLTLAVGPGLLLTEGTIQGTARVVDAAGGARATLNLTAKDAVLRDAAGISLDTATITADGPLDRLPVRIQASGVAPNGAYGLDAGGILTEVRQGEAVAWQLTLDGTGKVGRAQLRTTETARLVFGGPVTEAHLRLATVGRQEGAPTGTAVIDARIAKGSADIQANVSGLPLAAANEDLAGRLDARLVLRGQGERLEGQLNAEVKNVRARGSGRSFTLDGSVEAKLADRWITITAKASSAQGLNADANFVLPAEASAAPLRLAIDRRRQAQGKFTANGEIKPLWDLLMGGDRSLSGQVRLAGSLGGTLADPRLLGEASLTGGAYEDGPTGLRLRNLTLAAAFADNAIDVTQASASDPGGGKASGSGRISLLREGTSSFRLDLTRFQVIDNDLATATASGQVTINRTAAGNPRVEGALRIDRAEIAAEPLSPSGVTPMDVIEINKPRTPAMRRAEAAAATRQRGGAIDLAIELDAARGIFVEGRGLNVEMSLDARVTGTTAKPNLTGVARVVRGDYDFAGKRFEFDERGEVILSTDPNRIRLNLTATREDPSLTAVVRVQGTAAKPEITLTSTPQLPQDEVLSRVLFGSSAAQLSPFEAAQLASALAALAGGGGFDVIGNIRQLAGLDRLTIGGTDLTGVTVAGGKYLTNDVYLELIGGGRQGGAVQVEWRVRRNLSIVSRIAGGGESKLSVRWRRDY